MSSFKYAIALTGGIATGKSTVSKIFTKYGYDIIDADSIAHQILDENSHTIAEMFGHSYVTNGIVDRVKLGLLVFGDTTQKSRLEKLLHPLIREEIISIADSLDKLERPYLIDIPLFYETSSYPIDDVIVVFTPPSIQLERLIQRDGISKSKAMEKIATQIDIYSKRDRAKYIIDNSRDLEYLQNQCDRVKEMIDESY